MIFYSWISSTLGFAQYLSRSHSIVDTLSMTQIFFALFSIPISSFLNIQSMTVPLAHRMDPSLSSTITASSQSYSTAVLLFSISSLLSGLLCNICLVIRMLERKVKWTTRLMIVGALLQGIFGLFALGIFHAIDRTNEHIYTEAVVYKILSCICSVGSALLVGFSYLTNLKRNQVYAWLFYDLSNEQRQFILLTVFSMTYLSLIALIYSHLEDWPFELSLYWCISTFLTIGFGEVVPKSFYGLLLFPIVTSAGVLLVAAVIYAMRNVFLESLAIRLASNYSKFTMKEEDQYGNERSFEEFLQGPTSSQIPHGLGIKSNNKKIERRLTDTEICLSGSLDSNRLTPSIHVPEESSSTRLIDNQRVFENQNRARNIRKRKTLKITRSKRLPSVTIVGNHNLSETLISKATKQELYKQTYLALFSVLINVTISSGVFAFLEEWSFAEGFYFTYCAFMTIGYGDYILQNYISRSIFIWYIFFVVGSWTYLISMVAEVAFDEWIVETKGIAKRVGRYETKAKWKQMYSPLLRNEGNREQPIDINDSDSEIAVSDKKGKQISFEIHDKGSDSSEEGNLMLLDEARMSSDPLDIESCRIMDSGTDNNGNPLAYSVSISRSREPSLLLRGIRVRSADSNSSINEESPLLDVLE